MVTYPCINTKLPSAYHLDFKKNFFHLFLSLSLTFSFCKIAKRMGALDYLSNFCSATSTRSTSRSRRKPMQACILISHLSSLISLLLIIILLSLTRMVCGLVSQTVEIKVKMDCDGCERRVKNSVKSMKGLSTSGDYLITNALLNR